jgi:predicted MFS family arabinose efflux permease
MSRLGHTVREIPVAGDTSPRPVTALPAAARAPGAAVEPSASAGGLVALGLAGFCSFLGVYATQPLLPLFGRVFGVSKAEAALTISAPTIAVALAAPFVGSLGDRLGRRRVMVGSLFALAVPMLLAATATSVPALVAWRFAQGLAVPGVYAVGIAYATSEWPGGRVGRAMAALITGNVIGGFTGRAVSGVAAEVLGWRAAFVALGVLTVAGAAATWRWLPRPTRPAASQDLPIAALRALARRLDARLVVTFTVGFNVLFTQVAIFTYVTFYLADPPFRLGAAALSWIFVVYLVGAVVTPSAGRWIDRVGSRRMLTLALAGAMAGSPFLLSSHVGVIVLGLALCCTANFISQAAGTVFLRTAAQPEIRSVASGVYLSSYYVGGAVGGILPAAAWHVGGWPACVALVAAVQLVTIALALRFWRDDPAVVR